jgi:hypothetical protein
MTNRNPTPLWSLCVAGDDDAQRRSEGPVTGYNPSTMSDESTGS